MYCRNCGKQLSNDAFICPDCGAPATKYARHTVEARNATLNRNCTAIGVVCAIISAVMFVLFVVGAVLGYFISVMQIVFGIALFATAFTGLIFSITGLIGALEDNNFKRRAFAVSGIVVSGLFLLGFMLVCLLLGII